MEKKIFQLCFLLIAALAFVACGGSDNDGDDPVVPTPTSGSVTISAPQLSDISSTTVNATAKVTVTNNVSITARGFCYATTAAPTVNNQTVQTTSNDMLATISGLQPATTYYVRGYAQTATGVTYSEAAQFTTLAATEQEEEQTEWPSALKRVSVHDPSVVWDATTGNYYIFGSHRAAARSTNLMTWVAFQAPWATAASTNAGNAAAFTNPQVTKVKKGGQEVDFKFDAFAWSKRGNTNYSVDGNMWAPDVIYNKALQKWCMYLSINGDYWYSSIIMLTADKITGPYRYQAPVVISGFHTGTTYKSTDLEIVLGTQASLPARYNVGNSWGNRYPNCIDPCVFYDEQGKLWMS